MHVGCKIHTIYVFSCTPSPCTHTHVVTPFAHEHRVSHRVPLAGEAKGAQIVRGSWGGRDGVQDTPRHVVQQQNFPLFWPLASAWSTPGSACTPRRSRNSAAVHCGHTYSTPASNWPPNTPATATIRGDSKGGTLLQTRGVCKQGGACRLDVRTCAPRGHPVVSIAAAQPSALAGGRRASAARREKPVAQRVTTTTA